MLRQALLQASRSGRVRSAVESAPVSRAVVRRYVPGTDDSDAVRACRELTDAGLVVSLDHLGEDTTDAAAAAAVRDAYVRLLAVLADEGLTQGGRTEVSVKLSAVGGALGAGGPGGDGGRVALDHARDVCAAARAAGTTVTLDMEDHTTTDATLEAVRALRADFPDVGAVLQAQLCRTEADCRDLAVAGSRVRLCKGAYAEPPSVAHGSASEVDLAYVRCLKVLMAGAGYPMVATHDPRLVAIAAALAVQRRRDPGTYEYQMLYGVRPDEQVRLAAGGETVRVYVPYGSQWYGYLVRRLAERPANLAFFARSLLSRS